MTFDEATELAQRIHGTRRDAPVPCTVGELFDMFEQMQTLLGTERVTEIQSELDTAVAVKKHFAELVGDVSPVAKKN